MTKLVLCLASSVALLIGMNSVPSVAYAQIDEQTAQPGERPQTGNAAQPDLTVTAGEVDATQPEPTAERDWLKDHVGDLATWLTVVVAVWYGGKQIKWSREDAREATAITTWMGYYLQCLQYPRYGCPETLKLDFTKLDKLGSAKEVRESDEYQWFVSYMLLACDLVIQLPKDKGGPNWEQFVRDNVGYHSEYLKSRYFKENYELTLSPELNRKIKEVLDEDGEKQTGEGA